MAIYTNISELVGKTPVMELVNYEKNHLLNAKLYAKLELFNISGSIKARIALAMIEDAEKNGIIKPSTTIIEPTSGNTGVGLAAVCASKGYRIILTMPESMSIERRNLLKAYGAELVLTEASKGMQGAVDKAIQLSKELPDSFIPSQFENMSNPECHKNTTGVEIWDDMQGKIDYFVAGIGTGGTISGVGEYLKSKNPNIKIIAVEPYTSPLLSKGTAGPHGLQGIGANFIPKTLNTDIYDEIITVTNDDAYNTGRELAQKEGLLVGITSGASVYAASVIAQRTENFGKNIVVILPDTGERYLSTPMFNY